MKGKSHRLFLFFIYILPKNLLSRLLGGLTGLILPQFILQPIMNWFIKKYGVNTKEAELPIQEYRSINLFFTRALKNGVRVVNQSPGSVVSPVDSRISQYGEIQNGKMIQAKGIDYSLESLLKCSEYESHFIGGSYITLYLSPPDYHRIHTPYEGEIMGFSYTPGKLFPVHEIAVNGISELFCRNERLTTYIQTDFGIIAVVKVGATNVGRIRVVYDDIVTNRWFRSERLHIYEKKMPISRGAELARFDLGSTVILLFERDKIEFLPELKEGMRIRFGEALGLMKGS